MNKTALECRRRCHCRIITARPPSRPWGTTDPQTEPPPPPINPKRIETRDAWWVLTRVVLHLVLFAGKLQEESQEAPLWERLRLSLPCHAFRFVSSCQLDWKRLAFFFFGVVQSEGGGRTSIGVAGTNGNDISKTEELAAFSKYQILSTMNRISRRYGCV
jgi:hypothetical protein